MAVGTAPLVDLPIKTRNRDHDIVYERRSRSRLPGHVVDDDRDDELLAACRRHITRERRHLVERTCLAADISHRHCSLEPVS